jgi:copper chaperone
LEAKAMKTVLNVKGMKCGGCETSVREAVKSCPGVTEVRPNFRENQVEIEYEEGKADLEAISQVISAKGFQVGA